MNRKLIKQVFSLMLALTLVLALSSCAVSPQELLDMLTENSEGESSGQTSPEEGGEALPEGDTVPDGSTDQQPPQTSGGQNTKPGPVRPGKGEGTPPGGNNTPGGSTGGNLPLASGSAEGAQSLAGLRELYDLPDVMFGATYLGYVEEPVAAGSSQWLWEVNETMAQQYPFLTEIDANHIIGSAGYLYCIVPQDENATLAINRIQWSWDTAAYEVTEVLYRAETGEPVLLFANLDGVAYEIDTQIFVTDSSGNTCEWEPSLDAMSYLTPCVTENGNYLSYDFTEYAWQSGADLSAWLADGYTGMTALGLAGPEEMGGTCWTTTVYMDEVGRNAIFYLWFYPGDEAGGMVDLDWHYEGSDVFEEMWSGFWEIETTMDAPSQVTLSLFEVGAEYHDPAKPLYIDETYPMVISLSGLELVIGTGAYLSPLPFMTWDNTPCVLTLLEW